MPRFYFHLCDGSLVTDEEGREFSSLAVARDVARYETRELIAEDARHGHIDLSHRIEIADDAGMIVAMVHFRDSVAVEG